MWTEMVSLGKDDDIVHSCRVAVLPQPARNSVRDKTLGIQPNSRSALSLFITSSVV